MNISLLKSKIDNALVAHGYQHAKLGIFASFFCSVIILLGLFQSSFKFLLFGWFITGLVIGIIRLLLVRWYMHSNTQEDLNKWCKIFVIGSSLNGLFWGMSTFLFLPLANPHQQTLLLLTLTGISAGGVPFLAAILPAVQLFLIFSLMPLIPTLLMMHKEIILYFDFSVMVYIIYLLNLSTRINKMIKTSISLQYENQFLVQSLSSAKYNLEETNHKLIQAATHDPLTNVANRTLFKENFAKALQKAQENQTAIALLYIDLDGFKQVNDTHGHDMGDQVLLLVVARLKVILGNNDIISRLGGDELTVILENIKTPEDAAIIAKQICVSLSAPMVIDHINIHVSASIGISIYPNDADNMDKLLLLADKTMYRVKEHGGNNFHFNIINK